MSTKKKPLEAFERVNHLIRAEAIEKIMKIQIVSEDRAREQMHREDPKEDGYSYQGGEETRGALIPGMMTQEPRQSSSLEYSGGGRGAP